MTENTSKMSPEHRRPHADLLKIKSRLVGGCQLCGGAGHVGQVQCSCMDEMIAICWLDKAGVLPEYWLYNIEDMKISDDLKSYITTSISAYALDRQNWKRLNLHIFGSYRVGKTTLAACLMKEFIKKQSMATCGYVTSRELMISARGKDQGEADLAYLTGLDLLVIDEIGKELEDKFFFPAFMAFFDVLLRNRRGSRATILISNENPNELHNRYGNNISLMLAHDFQPIPFLNMPKLGVASGQ